MSRASAFLLAGLLLAPATLTGTALAQTAPPTTAPAPAPTTPATPAPTSNADTPIVLSGLLDAPRSLTLADLKAMPSRAVQVTYTSGSGATMTTNTHTYRGVLLYDVLMAAKPQLRAGVKNDALRLVVRATAADGYVAVFSWGELDPGFGNRAVLLAYEEDGVALPARDGAVRLVVPGDGKGGRYVSSLTGLQVLRPE